MPSTPNGVGPGLVLGHRQHAGARQPLSRPDLRRVRRLLQHDTDPNEHVNPTTNTDIFLAYSDDGGQTWVSAGMVNDDACDHRRLLGVERSTPTGAYTSGRTQFQPEIAVDQATGTLVVSWRDARDDAANARVATYITTSIDGGQTFSAQTYANPPEDRDRRDHGPDRCPGPGGR